MTFTEKLIEYMERIDISATQLAKASGNIDVSTINRYRNGTREPNPNGRQLKCLAKGINTLADQKGIPLSGQDVFASLYETLTNGLLVDYDTYLANLNHLLSVLDIKIRALAEATTYDPSHISKILSGQRRPGNIGIFTKEVSEYIAHHCDSALEIYIMAKLMHQETEAIQDPQTRQEAIVKWLGTNIPTEIEDMVSQISRFLKKISAFSLDEFIQTIHLQDTSTPTSQSQLPSVKSYEGIEEMRQCELDFINATVISESMQDCILYSDMPLKGVADDKKFSEKWMLGMESLLEKGLHLHIIHDVNRPLSEMLLGLEQNIPLYMTGQVSPYYLPSAKGHVFHHTLKVSGAAALEGNAIAGHQDSGRYILTTFNEDVMHYQKSANQLLSKARPLMDIYNAAKKEDFWAYMRQIREENDKQIIYCSLPIFTMDDGLLNAILERNCISDEISRKIKAFRLEQLTAATELLEKCKIVLNRHF